MFTDSITRQRNAVTEHVDSYTHDTSISESLGKIESLVCADACICVNLSSTYTRLATYDNMQCTHHASFAILFQTLEACK